MNLAPNEGLSTTRWAPPIKIYLGSNLYMETKEFRRNLYVGLYKTDGESGEVKNRLNFPLTQIEKVEEALKEIKEHVRDNA